MKNGFPTKTDKTTEGFVLFEPTATGRIMQIGVSLESYGIRLSYGALEKLNFPEYCHILFDVKTRRMMIKIAQKTDSNTFQIKTTNVKGKNTNLGYIQNARLKKAVMKITAPENEKDRQFWNGCQPEGLKNLLIFDLSKYKLLSDIKEDLI